MNPFMAPEPATVTDLEQLLSWLSNVAAPTALRVFLAGAVYLLLTAAVWTTVQHIITSRLRRTSRLLEIVPPTTPTDPDAATAFWIEAATALTTRRFRLPRFAVFDITISAKGARFGLWLPDTVDRSRIAHAVVSAWPGASLREPEWDPVPCVRDTVVRRLVPRDSIPQPGAAFDPLPRITGQSRFTDPDTIHRVWIAVRPAPTRLQRRAPATPGRALARIGQSMRDLGGGFPSLRDLYHGTYAKPAPPGRVSRPEPPPWTQDRPLWQITAHIHCISDGQQAAASGVAELAGAFAGFRNATGLAHRRVLAGRYELPAVTRGFLAGNSELARLAHLPTDPPDTDEPDTSEPSVPPALRIARSDDRKEDPR